MAATVVITEVIDKNFRGEEALAEAVRAFPVLYDKSIKDFKDKNKKENAWKQVAEQAGCSVDEAKRKFLNLRNRYSKDKNKIKSKSKSGGATADVLQAKNEVSQFSPYLSWLDSFVIPRRRTCTNVPVNCEDGAEDALACDEIDEDDEEVSEVTGRPKWGLKKRKLATPDESFDKQVLSCLAQLPKANKPTETAKDEDDLFGAFISA